MAFVEEQVDCLWALVFADFADVVMVRVDLIFADLVHKYCDFEDLAAELNRYAFRLLRVSPDRFLLIPRNEILVLALIGMQSLQTHSSEVQDKNEIQIGVFIQQSEQSFLLIIRAFSHVFRECRFPLFFQCRREKLVVVELPELLRDGVGVAACKIDFVDPGKAVEVTRHFLLGYEAKSQRPKKAIPIAPNLPIRVQLLELVPQFVSNFLALKRVDLIIESLGLREGVGRVLDLYYFLLQFCVLAHRDLQL